jgi:predicted Fe-Mo cluster-binding NifX family protein
MKIAVTAQGNELTSQIDPRFGRAKYFIIYDLETGESSVSDNEVNLQLAQGAGIQAGQAVVNMGVSAVITGNVGPKAFRVLQAGNVQVYIGAAGTVQQAIEDYKQGRLKKVDGATVEGHWM